MNNEWKRKEKIVTTIFPLDAALKPQSGLGQMTWEVNDRFNW